MQAQIQMGGVWGVLPTLAGKCREFFESWRVFFFGKIRHNKQKLSINLTFFPFSFDQMFTNSSMYVYMSYHNIINHILLVKNAVKSN